MPTPADQRLLELLEKWLTSLELHIKYSSLDDASYWKIQPWVKHQRPSRWIIDLARQKIVALQTQVQERIKQGDATFSDSLEQMTFLANLVGAQHIERFIPFAEAADSKQAPETATAPAAATAAPPTKAPAAAQAAAPVAVPAAAPTPAPAPAADASQTAANEGINATREMPKFVATPRDAPPPGSAQVARAERKAPGKANAGASAKPANRQATKPTDRPSTKPADRQAAKPADRDQVTADAIRLVQWGRKWYELAELIARMADRPPLPEVRRILEENKSKIEKKARGE